MSVASNTTTTVDAAVDASSERVALWAALVERLRSPKVNLGDIAKGVAAIAQGVLDVERAKIERAAKAKVVKESGGSDATKRKTRTSKAPKREVEGDAPDVSEYRIASDMIRLDLCIGRRFRKDPDMRWTKPVMYEEQCTAKAIDGSALCVACSKRQTAYADDPAKGAGTKTVWAGVINEEPLDTTHMLGTAWAKELQDKGKLKWLGYVKEKKVRASKSGGGGGAASVVSRATAVSKPDPEADAEDVPVEEPDVEEPAMSLRQALAAILKDMNNAEFAAYTPSDARTALGAVYGHIADFKDQVKTALKEEKELMLAARAARPPPPKAAAAAAVKPLKTKAIKPVKPAGTVQYMDGTPYWVLENGNAYEYDPDTEKSGAFAGVFDVETGEFDADADEVC